ncbi:trypco2 family protein [Luedemannella helvata]|uniref:Trypsin-co-occurring domain-containing protein n=1 Tax=Luedemannella helvata TaxID=349315 RepID=A0ABP4WMU8_9ACTN
MEKIELADVIRNLRSELDRAIDGARGQRLQFDLGPIELEVSVSLEQTDDVKAGIKFWVVDVGAGLNDKNIATQRLKLTLTPTIDAGGQRTNPRVSGQAVPGEE